MNFATDTLWFEVAVIASIFALGQIFFGHFELHTAKWRKVLKIVFFTCLACTLTSLLGRTAFFVFLGILCVAVMVVHAWWLPKKGINGLTGKPREKYYALRGWTLKD
jgi:hypothetical protein